MTMFNNLLKVIFWLSTIVAATDCCYSQILPRLNQNLVLIVQQKSEEIDAEMKAASIATTTTTILNLAEEEVSSLKQQQTQHQYQHQHQQQNLDDTYFFQIEIDKYLQHIKDFINSIAINPNKTKTGNIAHLDSIVNDNNNNNHNDNFIKSTTMTIYNNNNKYNHNDDIIELPVHINTTILKTLTTLPLNKITGKTNATATVIATAAATATTTATTTATPTVIATATVTPTVTVNNDDNDDNDDIKYDFLELYTFMSDTLSTLCSGEYASQYCLNNGQCFVHLVGLFYCKCAEGYVGERCESKYIYAMSGGYRSSSSNSSGSGSGTNSGSIIRTVEEKKPKILSAGILMPLRALLFLIILYLSLSLLWSYKSSQCVISQHGVATKSSHHFIY